MSLTLALSFSSADRKKDGEYNRKGKENHDRLFSVLTGLSYSGLRCLYMLLCVHAV